MKKKEESKTIEIKNVKGTKTHHQAGYHKPVKNPTTNYPPDSHKEFCKRCRAINKGCHLGTYRCSV